MSELIDPRPLFTVVMGCNGVGKSTWKRGNYDRLPDNYIDQDSLAGGLGDWNSTAIREKTRRLVDDEIEGFFRDRLDFGMESTYSGRPGPAMVARARDEGYRIEGIYLGTQNPEINIARIEWRVLASTGHEVNPSRIPTRWKFSLSNLRKTAASFDLLEIFDNSTEDAEFRRPMLNLQVELERGRVTQRADPLAGWCADWLRSLEQRQETLRRLGR